MKENMQPAQAANWLTKQLKAHGFVVQRYDAVSTKSIYLKMDYGMGNSIRISDHRGYKYLKYRFNVDCDFTGKPYWKKQNGFLRIYFGASKVQLRQLVDTACRNRAAHIQKYGYERYYELMARNKIEKPKAARSHTFWTQAKEV